MAQDRDSPRREPGPDRGRRGERLHEGGASKEGHLEPGIDTRGGKSEGGGQIAQDRQQSSGQGAGQS